MSVTRLLPSAFALSILVTAACSSSTPQAETAAAAGSPKPAPATAPEAKPTELVAQTAPPKAAAQAKESPTAPEQSTPAPAAEEEPAGPPPEPSEILVAEKVAFEIDDEASALRIILQDKCEQRVGYESEAVAQCVESERAKFAADVLRFRKMGGQLRWTVYKRKGDQLQVVYSAPFTFTDETDYGVSLVPQGGTGYRPLMSQARSVPLTFPSTDSIQLDDPVWGQLIYKSKTGLVVE